MSKVIAFIGERKSGKDFFAEHLEKRSRGMIKRLSFSDEVRRIAHAMYPWLPFYVSPEDKDKPFEHPMNQKGLTPRQIWLTVGKLRDVDSTLFVREFIKNQYEPAMLQARDGDNRCYVITDFRTADEDQFLAHYGIPVIKVLLADRTGIEPCDFEQFTRDYDQYDAAFINGMDGTTKFDDFFDEFLLSNHLLDFRYALN